MVLVAEFDVFVSLMSMLLVPDVDVVLLLMSMYKVDVLVADAMRSCC